MYANYYPLYYTIHTNKFNKKSNNKKGCPSKCERLKINLSVCNLLDYPNSVCVPRIAFSAHTSLEVRIP